MKKVPTNEEKAALIIAATIDQKVANKDISKAVERWIQQASDGDEDFADTIQQMQGNLPEALVAMAVLAAGKIPQTIAEATKRGNLAGLTAAMTDCLNTAERVTALQEKISRENAAKSGFTHEISQFDTSELTEFWKLVQKSKKRRGVA